MTIINFSRFSLPRIDATEKKIGTTKLDKTRYFLFKNYLFLLRNNKKKKSSRVSAYLPRLWIMILFKKYKKNAHGIIEHFCVPQEYYKKKYVLNVEILRSTSDMFCQQRF